MSRARMAALGALGAAALAASGVAAADHRTQTTQQAAATFGAATVSHNRTTSCVASDGTYETTNATYAGTATSGDGRLSGPFEIVARSVFNKDKQLGWLDGSFRIRNGGAGSAHGTIHAAIAGGDAVGTVTGTVNRPQGKLVASFALSGFSPSGGFSGGTLGSGPAVPSAGTIFTRGACIKAKNFAKTAVFKLRLTPGEVVSTTPASRAGASGTLRLQVTRDSTGAITGTPQLTFRISYHFASPVDISKLALYPGEKGATGTAIADTGTIATHASRGTVTTTVTGISTADAQNLLSNPQTYYVQLDTSVGALRDQLGGYKRR